MKKIIQFCVLFMGVSLFLSSCGSLTVKKRHFNKGYYVDFNSNRTFNNDKDKKEVLEELSLEKSDQKTLNQSETLVAEEGGKGIQTQEESQVIKQKPSGINALVSKDILIRNDIASSLQENKSDEKANTNHSGLKKIKKIHNTLEKQLFKKMPAPKSDSGHGLLWTIIVVLLILWILGLLFGVLGNLIHLLVLIILILILLRLLGMA